MEAIPGGRIECESKKRSRDPPGLPASLTTGTDVSRKSSGNRPESLTSPSSMAGGLEDQSHMTLYPE